MRIKRRTFSGDVCEQEVFTVPNQTKRLKTTEPNEWFKSEEERLRHEWLASRRRFTQRVNATFSSASLYSTLTLNNANEVHTFEEAKKLRDNFVRRLRYVAPGAQIMMVMGRGKNTDRIHFHMLSNGIEEDIIRDKWTAGNVTHIKQLKSDNYYGGVNHGADYTGLAHYLFDHWTPEQGAHRWKQTNNINQPDREEPTIIKREYSPSKPPRAPKGFMLVEAKTNDFGYQYYKYVRIPEPARTRRC